MMRGARCLQTPHPPPPGSADPEFLTLKPLSPKAQTLSHKLQQPPTLHPEGFPPLQLLVASWLWNPLVINVSTRGNAEAVVSLFVLGALWGVLGS